MQCPTCQATIRDGAAHCPQCGARLASAHEIGPLPSVAPTILRSRRRFGGFWAGLLVGGLAVPLLVFVLLLLGGRPNDARRALPMSPNQPDISVLLSRPYLEQALAQNATIRNPVVELGPHPQGGAAMTLTLSIELPLVGFRDVQARSHIMAENGDLVITTERLGLGESGWIGIPGNFVERKVSDVINGEIDKRIRSNPDINVEITFVGVNATSEALQVDALIEQKQ